MLTKLSQLLELIDKSHNPKRMILAASEDADSLTAVVEAAKKEIIRPILVGDLEKTRGIAEIMKLDISDFERIEADNPADAAAGTVRAEFAESVGENSVHGSDAPETAAIEIAYFFSGLELVG